MGSTTTTAAAAAAAAAAQSYDQQMELHKAEKIYSSPFSAVFKLHGINKFIHSIDHLPKLAEFCVFLLGYAFNPVSIPLLLVAATAMGAAPASLIKLAKNNNLQQHSSDTIIPLLFAPIFYLSTVLVTLVATELCKASFRASRPESILSKDFLSSKVRRYGSLVASLKSKHSFPSGDSAQAANAVLWLSCYAIPSWAMKNNSNIIINATTAFAIRCFAFGVFYPGVAFARIFYHCHWIEDCLGGAVLAGFLHATIMPLLADTVWDAVHQFLPSTALLV